MALMEIMLLKVFELAVPVLVAKAEELCAAGVDPSTLTWDDVYGRSAAEIRAEVDARQRGEAPCPS